MSITWYDVLGVTAGASSDTLRRAYADRVAQLAPDVFSGAPAPVISAGSRARDSVEAAWLVLGDRARRHRYDAEIGLHRGDGLSRGGGFGAGTTRYGQDSLDGLRAVDGLLDGNLPAVLTATLAWMAPLPASARRRLIAPDVRGLFYRSGLAVMTTAGLKLTVERLTPDPRPVEGLVVGQSPAAGATVRHASTVTVQVWHPSARHRGAHRA